MRNRTGIAVAALALGSVVASGALGADKVDAALPWAQRMADSIIARQPKGTMLEARGQGEMPKWSYSAAFCVRAVAEVGAGKGAAGEKYVKYAQDYMDAFINDAGALDKRYYQARGHRLDDIAPGQLILLLAAQTKSPKYTTAALELAEQLKTQPRVAEGGFWHKDIYPHQMWLDGIFMDCPFMARLGAATGQPAYFDEVAEQITLMAKVAQDPTTGLCYHGWDESKSEKWADPATGLSKCFWGRGMGWYMAGIVDALDYLPAEHPQRAQILAILQKAAAGVTAVQDAKTGVWWQVLDQGERAGNYRESSASCMITYALAKAARKGYVEAKYAEVAKKAYAGILREFIDVDAATGLVSLKETCQVAGLGGTPYRDGSYAYYLREPRAVNDTKGMAPFILASLEMQQ